jgi:hypothetical protein
MEALRVSAMSLVLHTWFASAENFIIIRILGMYE